MSTIPLAPNQPPSPALPEQTVQIYALCDPRTSEVRYIGQAVDAARRYNRHLWDRRTDKTYKGNWLRALQGEGLVPALRILDVVPLIERDRAEQYYIAQHRALGDRLTNTTAGGGGALGHAWSAESRAKQRRHRLAYLAAHPQSGQGDANGQRRHPERTVRGDRHWKRLHPERIARGEQHWTRLHPERIKRGKEHASYGHSYGAGEANPAARLTWAKVREIRSTWDPSARRGPQTMSGLARSYGVSVATIWLIVHGHKWKEDAQLQSHPSPDSAPPSPTTPVLGERAVCAQPTVTLERAGTPQETRQW